MTKQEFEKLARSTVTNEEYKIIEKVYTWHPAIRNTDGKNQIATIFLAGGMAVMKNMQETAEYMIRLDKEMAALKAQMEKVKNRMEAVASGDLSYERCLEDVERAFDESQSSEEFVRMLKLMEIKYGEETPHRIAAEKQYA